MITGQIIQNSIDDLQKISKVDLCVFDLDGLIVASTFQPTDLSRAFIDNFANSPADSQVIGVHHLFKIYDENELTYILIVRGGSDDVYTSMIAKICVSQIQALIIAYKERLDRNNFFQNLMLDNLLLVDIYNRAKKLRVEVSVPRVVFLIEACIEKDNSAMEILKEMFNHQAGDYLTAVDERNIILIKKVEAGITNEELTEIGSSIVDLINTEAMLRVKVAYGSVVNEIKDVSKSYKEAKMALEVGKIFYDDKYVIPYPNLGIGRLIYQLPENLCRIFIDEIFKDGMAFSIDEETLTTVNKFFENDLNVSKTAEQLYVHRNTLVYRIEKLEKATGLNVREFDDALTFKIALMVVNYIKYLESRE
ncbi:MAG: helix-turn-helix domain-containing protein [Lachnospiraceae bacterium]|nr:helix-turn-helix domain-containing protein [Lachnospiraceae bacterium]